MITAPRHRFVMPITLRLPPHINKQLLTVAETSPNAATVPVALDVPKLTATISGFGETRPGFSRGGVWCFLTGTKGIGTREMKVAFFTAVDCKHRCP